MRRYLLDSNAVSALVDHRGNVPERVREARLRGARIGTCEPVVAELFYGLEFGSSRKEHPPDVVLRAYAGLMNQVFVFLRCRSHDPLGREELFDLGDALHNIGMIFTDYGGWVDDEKYRQLYLRPFDAKWGKNSISLEQCLQAHLEEHSLPNNERPIASVVSTLVLTHPAHAGGSLKHAW